MQGSLFEPNLGHKWLKIYQIVLNIKCYSDSYCMYTIKVFELNLNTIMKIILNDL